VISLKDRWVGFFCSQ